MTADGGTIVEKRQLHKTIIELAQARYRKGPHLPQAIIRMF
jgi:hypothetical protein